MSNLKLPMFNVKSLAKRFPKRDQKIAYATTIDWNDDKTKCAIYHHGNLIAVIDESGKHGHQRVVMFSNGGWTSKTTVHRLNAILHDTTSGYYGARIKQFQDYVYCTQSHVSGGFMHELSSRFYAIVVNDDYPSNLKLDGRMYE